MKKGISLAVLSVVILVMVILATALTTTGSMALNNSKKLKFASEITFVQEQVDKYVNEKNEYPASTLINVDLSKVTTASIAQFSNETKTGKVITLYEVDFSVLEKTDLIYGNKDKETDIYALSKDTGKVYYLDGIKVKNITYYTLTNDLKELIGYDLTETESSNPETKDTGVPTIEVISTEQIVSERNNEKSTYIKVNINDTFSGIKYAKYETADVSTQNVKQYFSSYGYEIKDNAIVVDRYVTAVTIYAEDNKGNYSTKVVNLTTTLSEKDYIQDGIVTHYDGTNNTGSGHDSNTTVWKDLSKTGNDVTIGSANSFDSNSCVFQKNKNSGFSPVNPLLLGVNGGFTIECVAKSNTTATSETEDNSLYDWFWNLRDSSSTVLYLQFIRNYGGEYTSGCTIDRTQIFKIKESGGSIASLQVVAANNSIKVYYNGELKDEKNITTEQLNKLLSLNNLDIGYGRWYKGTSKLINLNGHIYSFRIYNRPLSKSEITKNYKVDKLRFGI